MALTKYFTSEELENEKSGLICKISGSYNVFWATAKVTGKCVNTYIHYIKIVAPENENAYFDIATGKQIIVDKKYIDIPQSVFNGLRSVLSSKIAFINSNNTFYEQLFERINFANKDEDNYLVITASSSLPPKFHTIKKPGRKREIYLTPDTSKVKKGAEKKIYPVTCKATKIKRANGE